MNPLFHWQQEETDMNLIEFLLNQPGFNTLSDDELDMLDKIMLINNYPCGHKFKSNDNVYLILDGDVAVTNKRKCGTLQLDRIHSGELFGLSSVIDDSVQAATCTAVGPVKAASIPRSAFELLFNSDIPLSNHFHQIIAHQQMQQHIH